MSNYAVINDSTNICDNVIVWDPNENPWDPPADHYAVNIDGLEVGIGWHYDPSTNVWVGPPYVYGRFSTQSISLGQSASFTWGSNNVNNVVLNGESVSTSGSQNFTPTVAGKFTVNVEASNIIGPASYLATLTVDPA